MDLSDTNDLVTVESCNEFYDSSHQDIFGEAVWNYKSINFVCKRISLMCKLVLNRSLEQSLSSDVNDIIGYVLESGLDTMVEDGFFRNIPLINTIVSFYKIADSIRLRDYLAKTCIFLKELNDGAITEEKRNQYKLKLINDEKFSRSELERILILIDRYIDSDKPKMLAKLFMACLDEIIDISEFKMYSEILDQLIIGDLGFLKAHSSYKSCNYESIGTILRLMSLGLFVEDISNTMYRVESNRSISFNGDVISVAQNKERLYIRTDIGNMLVSILCDAF